MNSNSCNVIDCNRGDRGWTNTLIPRLSLYQLWRLTWARWCSWFQLPGPVPGVFAGQVFSRSSGSSKHPPVDGVNEVIRGCVRRPCEVTCRPVIGSGHAASSSCEWWWFEATPGVNRRTTLVSCFPALSFNSVCSRMVAQVWFVVLFQQFQDVDLCHFLSRWRRMQSRNAIERGPKASEVRTCPVNVFSLIISCSGRITNWTFSLFVCCSTLIWGPHTADVLIIDWHEVMLLILVLCLLSEAAVEAVTPELFR